MNNSTARIQRLAAQVRVGWTPARSHEVQERAARGLRRGQQLRMAAAVALVAAAASAALVSQRHLLWPSEAAPVAVVPAASSGARNALTLEDGSVVDLEGADTVVETLETTASSTEIRVVRGTATFRVVHNPARVFRVRAGKLTAEVIGTVFTVQRGTDGARVIVRSGRVLVSHGGQESVLGEGQSVAVPGDDQPLSAPVASVEASPVESSRPEATEAPRSWRDLARDFDYEAAYRSLERAGRGDVRDQPDDLLLAADVARLSHHPADALPHLRAVVSRYPRDPRAPLAAFTLGRVLLESLGRPGEAAAAFRTAQDLAPSGLLVEDALAREVEALSRAGDTGSAKARAELYLRRHPQGRKVASVRRHGGLD